MKVPKDTVSLFQKDFLMTKNYVPNNLLSSQNIIRSTPKLVAKDTCIFLWSHSVSVKDETVLHKTAITVVNITLIQRITFKNATPKPERGIGSLARDVHVLSSILKPSNVSRECLR